MSDLFGNHIVGFSTRWCICVHGFQKNSSGLFLYLNHVKLMENVNEPSRGKTNNVVSDQVRHKPGCTVTEKS